MPLAPGATLGPYQIDTPLGEGGMGEVYTARDTRLGRTVAIKVLPEHVANDPDLRQRFEREARAIAALNHPNICTLHDVGSQDGVDFLVMEHLEGETVGQRIQREVLSADEAVQHGLALLAALEALHGHGLLHRDLKPSNLILTVNGLKVIDFGLTRAQPTPGDESTETGLDLTKAGTIVGTPRFMAPEVLRGHPASAQSDIFAVGALLYEALSCEPAFTGSSVFEIAEAVLHGNPPVLVGSDAVDRTRPWSGFWSAPTPLRLIRIHSSAWCSRAVTADCSMPRCEPTSVRSGSIHTRRPPSCLRSFIWDGMRM